MLKKIIDTPIRREIRTKACVVCCSSARLHKPQELYLKKYYDGTLADTPSFSRGARQLLSPDQSEREAVLREIEISIKEHKSSRVELIFPVTIGLMGDSDETAEKTAIAAQGVVQDRFNDPVIPVKLLILKLDGLYTVSGN